MRDVMANWKNARDPGDSTTGTLARAAMHSGRGVDHENRKRYPGAPKIIIICVLCMK